MFNINLGNESISYGDSNVSTVEAMADVMTAQESLETNWVQYNVLTAATENLESSRDLAVAMSDGNEGLALAVAKNGIATAMHSIGQDDLASNINRGTESLTAATESISDTLKTMWEKIKEIAKKAWKWMLGILEKIKNFIKNLFSDSKSSSGGGYASSSKKVDRLEDKIKKASDPAKVSKALATIKISSDEIAKLVESLPFCTADFTADIEAEENAIIDYGNALLASTSSTIKIGEGKNSKWSELISILESNLKYSKQLMKSMSTVSDAAERLNISEVDLIGSLDMPNAENYRVCLYGNTGKDVKGLVVEFNENRDNQTIAFFKDVESGKIIGTADGKFNHFGAYFLHSKTIDSNKVKVDTKKIESYIEGLEWSFDKIKKIIHDQMTASKDAIKVIDKLEEIIKSFSKMSESTDIKYTDAIDGSDNKRIKGATYLPNKGAYDFFVRTVSDATKSMSNVVKFVTADMLAKGVNSGPQLLLEASIKRADEIIDAEIV